MATITKIFDDIWEDLDFIAIKSNALAEEIVVSGNDNEWDRPNYESYQKDVAELKERLDWILEKLEEKTWE